MNYDYDDNFNFNDILSPIKSPYQQYVEENTCSYCKANGMAKFEGHTKKNCPEIAALSPCPLCGANGMENHTPKYEF
jgi:hypothetical protein